MLLSIPVATVAPGPCDQRPSVPYEPPELPVGARWGRAPAHHNREYVYPGRAVLVLPGQLWPEVPERCSNRNPFANDWYGPGEGTVLVCRRCGLDVT